MSREFPGQDPYLPPGVSPNDPHFTGPDYDSEVDIDRAQLVIGWLEEAEGTVQEASEMLVSLGESTPEIVKEDKKIIEAIEAIRDTLQYAIKIEEQKINGDYDDGDADFAYECARDDAL